MLLPILVGAFLLLSEPSYEDIFMQNPRGSNNRLNEETQNRQNNNRAFDSQNNNKGGYNVGDATSVKASNESQQYQMVKKSFNFNKRIIAILSIFFYKTEIFSKWCNRQFPFGY
jgi:hypothetical protein